jgi:hypothetical protein
LFKGLVIAVLLLLFVVSLIPQALAQGAASGESIGAFERGQAPVTPATKTPGLSTPRVSYWALAGLGRDPQALGKQPPAVTDAGMPYNPFSMYGPYGIYDQYGMYGPYGMYGQSGPGYGSGYGFNGFGLHDEWELVKVYNEENAQAAAAQAQAATPTSTGSTGKTGGAAAPAK